MRCLCWSGWEDAGNLCAGHVGGHTLFSVLVRLGVSWDMYPVRLKVCLGFSCLVTLKVCKGALCWSGWKSVRDLNDGQVEGLLGVSVLVGFEVGLGSLCWPDRVALRSQCLS